MGRLGSESQVLGYRGLLDFRMAMAMPEPLWLSSRQPAILDPGNLLPPGYSESIRGSSGPRHCHLCLSS